MKTLLFLTCFVLSSGFAYAQSKAITIFDEDKNMRSVELLNSPDNKDDCKTDSATGSIIEVEFDVDSKIAGFRLKTKYKGKLINLYLWFPEEAYTRLKGNEAEFLTTLVKKSNRVRVAFYTCGSKATADYVDSIRRL